MNKLILFLVRRKLGLKKFERFKFNNQKEDVVYYFGNKKIIKESKKYGKQPSGVSLNWLLDTECKIVKVGNKND